MSASTTAVLRLAGREAEENLEYELAALLYELAAENYPIDPDLSSYAQADIMSLRLRARDCRSAAHKVDP